MVSLLGWACKLFADEQSQIFYKLVYFEALQKGNKLPQMYGIDILVLQIGLQIPPLTKIYVCKNRVENAKATSNKMTYVLKTKKKKCQI